jgi:ADP-ribosylglycohydrolase
VVLPFDYRERVYAGWLGKCIGVRLGVPVENWTADQIARNLDDVRGFLPLPPGKLFQPDDDTAFPVVLARALEEYGRDVTAAQIGETVLNGLADGRCGRWPAKASEGAAPCRLACAG